MAGATRLLHSTGCAGSAAQELPIQEQHKERQRSQKLMVTIDALSEKMGKGTVGWGYRKKTSPGTYAARTESRATRQIGMS